MLNYSVAELREKTSQIMGIDSLLHDLAHYIYACVITLRNLLL